jgi:hypothetical protein
VSTPLRAATGDATENLFRQACWSRFLAARIRDLEDYPVSPEKPVYTVAVVAALSGRSRQTVTRLTAPLSEQFPLPQIAQFPLHSLHGVISMAKGVRGSVPPVGQDAQEEMTVFVLRMKGSADTMRNGFDALKQAVAAIGNGHTVVTTTKRLPAVPGKTELPEDLDLETEQQGVEDDEETVTIDAPAIPGNGKPRTFTKPKFMDTFDLSVSDKPWKDFMAVYAPKTDQEKYLLAALWVTENAKTPEFTIGHIFTLFRAAKWNEQVDFSQPIRYMKSKNSYFEHPSAKTWKLTQIGLDAARAVSKAG